MFWCNWSGVLRKPFIFSTTTIVVCLALSGLWSARSAPTLVVPQHFPLLLSFVSLCAVHHDSCEPHLVSRPLALQRNRPAQASSRYTLRTSLSKQASHITIAGPKVRIPLPIVVRQEHYVATTMTTMAFIPKPMFGINPICHLVTLGVGCSISSVSTPCQSPQMIFQLDEGERHIRYLCLVPG
jgi:hypothetical protein